MRICHVTVVHPPFDGRIFHKMAVSTAKCENETHLYAPVKETSVRDRVLLHPSKNFGGRIGRFLSTFAAVAPLTRINAHLYHFHDPELIPAMLLLKALTRKKIIMDVHEYNRAEIGAKTWIPKLVRGPLAELVWRVEILGARTFDCTIAATRELAEVYKPYARRIEYIRNFDIVANDDTSPPVEENSGDGIDIIHVGSTLQPRFDFMVEVARELRRVTGEKHRWCFLGVNTNLVDVSKIDQDLNITVLERVPFEEVARFYKRSRVGISYHPYNPRFLVALPIKIFEYMKHGLTVVMSDLPPVREFVEEGVNGYLVEENTIQAFVEKLVVALENAPDEKFAEINRKKIFEEVNWERENERLQSIYSSLS